MYYFKGNNTELLFFLILILVSSKLLHICVCQRNKISLKYSQQCYLFSTDNQQILKGLAHLNEFVGAKNWVFWESLNNFIFLTQRCRNWFDTGFKYFLFLEFIERLVLFALNQYLFKKNTGVLEVSKRYTWCWCALIIVIFGTN